MLGRGSIGGAALAVLLLLVGAAGIPAAPSPTTTAFVRVNQVGYPTGSSKRAYLMASVAEAGASFTVKSAAGVTVLSGRSAPTSAPGAAPTRSSTCSTSVL